MEQQPRPTLSREDLLRIQLHSGCAPATIRNWQRGRARAASAKRIEQALQKLEAERVPGFATQVPTPNG